MKNNKTITCILISLACVFLFSTSVLARSFSTNERPFMPTISADDRSIDEITVTVPLKKGYTAIYLKDFMDIKKPLREIKAQDFGLMLKDIYGNYIYSSDLVIKCQDRGRNKMLVTIKRINGKKTKGLKFYVPFETVTIVRIH